MKTDRHFHYIVAELQRKAKHIFYVQYLFFFFEKYAFMR